MFTWTRSAYRLLALITLAIALVMPGLSVAQPAPASTRIADASPATTASPITDTTNSVTAPPATPLVAPPRDYQVRPGDTLSAIAERLGVPGSWPAIYAANRAVIGADPDLLHPGTTLTIPAVRSNPQALQPPAGTARAVPAPSVGKPSVEPQARAPVPTPSLLPTERRAQPDKAKPTDMPQWLTTLLLGIGLLILVVLLGEPVVAGLGRRWRARPPARRTQSAQASPTQLRPVRMVFATHERLLVTRSAEDDAVVVLCSPGQDPGEILRVAAVVLPQREYLALANHLGLAAQAGPPSLQVVSE